MKTTLNIKSKEKPVEIDDFTSESFVYVHSNITESEEIDPVFETKSMIYIYDETEYTTAEWYRHSIKLLNERVSELEKLIKK